MKAAVITWWATTAIISGMMIYAAYGYLTDPAMVAAIQHLGFPDYFRKELAVAKIIGAVFLLAPFGSRLKEWAYAGFAIVFISAFIAHTATGDPVSARAVPLVFLGLLVVSYVAWNKQAPREEGDEEEEHH